MNNSGVQQNSFEETRRNSSVVCPQPRRVDVLDHHHFAQSLRWQVSHEMEICESNLRRKEMLDFILTKGGGCEQEDPFFTGSPPSRVSNPLTKDSLFKEELFVVAPPPLTTPRATKPPPPSSPRSGGGGCVRAVTNFGNKPPVRVVGFSCLDRDRRSSVPTLA
ncbi:unnamed protein product [Eruca vesicaria subsp. sativa]|uniref:Uncharacterized protein n=1 Tax=Eruca vesicaria subsp. sativa TaxID=29727 RepID=A0ABC8L7H0_ERUVS|nr:unnamed protein product [Eruca vesicaria subsp. sativa]